MVATELRKGLSRRAFSFFRNREISSSPETERSSVKVVKFGGDNMATVDNIKKSAAILASDPLRRVAVVSAPGRRFKDDEKVTDLLLSSSKNAANQEKFQEIFGKVRGRFTELSEGLFQNDMDSQQQVQEWLQQVEDGIFEKKTMSPADQIYADAYAASRGEWLMSQVFAKYIGKTYSDTNVRLQDATELIRINSKNQLLVDETKLLVQENLDYNFHVTIVGGFYGLDEEGHISTFERGGSDTTAAAIAAGLNAQSVEMFKKLHGVKAAQPDIVPYAKTIPEMTYDELFELAFRGFDVVQKQAVLPIYDMNIPIEVRSFDSPDEEGTRIVRERTHPRGEKITGVAGKSGYVAVTVKKEGMNSEQGILREILSQHSEHVGSIDHSPTITNAATTIFDASQLNGNYGETMESLKQGIKFAVAPDSIEVDENVGVLCVVGPQVKDRQAAASAKILRILDRNDIRVLAQSAIPGGVTLVYAIQGDQVDRAIKLVHDRTVHRRSITRGLLTRAA